MKETEALFGKYEKNGKITINYTTCLFAGNL